MRKLIGTGTFTKAYQIGENLVEVISSCLTKECYALFSEGNSLAPVVERIDHQTYHMPLYPKMTAPTQQLNKEGLSLYRQLRKIDCQISSYQDFCGQVEKLAIPEETKEDLISLAGDVCNGIDTQNLRFEISPRNVTTNENGDLILLDCFFCVRALAKVRSGS